MSTQLPTTSLVKRPAVGSLGQPITVRSNYFEVRKLPDITIHHYDITITPNVPPPVNRKIFKQLLVAYGPSDFDSAHPVYDGRKNMFSPKSLLFKSRTFDVTLAEDIRPNSKRASPVFKVKVREAAILNLGELHGFLKGRSGITNNVLTCIMALDVLIRNKPMLLHVTVGRSFFTPEGKQPLSGALEVWRGFYQSARPAVGKLMINLDVAASAFFQPGSLVEMAVKILGLRSPDDLRRVHSPSDWTKVERTIKGLRITVKHRERSNRTYKILSLTRKSARETTFRIENRKSGDDNHEDNPPEIEASIEQYFWNTYNLKLQFPDIPCVSVGKTAILPMELCHVVEGQRCMKKLDERQTADMIKFTAQSPQVRANAIKEGLRILSYDNNEFLKDFGMSVSSEMVTIKARTLPAPTILYHPSSRDANVVPRDGSWNLMGKKVAQGTTLGSWGVIVFSTEREIPQSQVNGFIRELVVTCWDTGMNIPNKNPPIVYSNPQRNIENALKQTWHRTGQAVKSEPQLIICILPNTSVSLYAEIKRVTDTVIGVSSQCIQMKHTRTPKKQYCANVCLKINVKLGGMNSQLSPTSLPFLTSKPTILLGADVSHPPPGDSIRPSIASLVGSMDSKASRYAASIRIQTARTETLADLSDMAIELLRTFYQTCGKKPERILFYRDGVSEGQFAEVLAKEVAALKVACTRLEATYRPMITFVVVQKNHHTRFFPVRREEGDRSGNCQPGLVIDTDIVHPIEFDFYLQSHAGLLGTSRSAHYHVLHDDNNFQSDELQRLTYNLCHLFARCTRAVSIAPPAYYAHIVAARARFHSRSEKWVDTASSETSTGDASSYLTVKPQLAKVMWFV